MRSRADRAPARRGFTLLELIVAMTLAALALLGARGLLDQLSDTRDRIRIEAERDTRRANAERLLRALVSRAGTEGDSSLRFDGTSLEAGFATWCASPGGWLERCLVSVAIERDGPRSRLIAQLQNDRTLTVSEYYAIASLMYFDPTRGWLAEWRSALSAPVAIGVVTETDTVVLRIGGGT